MKFSVMMRAPYVKRWGIVAVNREQNIAEHSFMVALIAEELYAALLPDEEPMEDCVSQQLCQLAIWHDMAECVTGDINSAYKEMVVVDERSICAGYDQAIRTQKHFWQENIIRIADKLEAIHYLDRHGVSCSDLVQVKEFLANKLYGLIHEADTEYPQFDWAAAVTRVSESMR